MGKKTLVIILCIALILAAAVGFFSLRQRWFSESPPTVLTFPTPMQTSSDTRTPEFNSTPTLTPTPSPTPTVLRQFGVCAQYYREDEKAAYFPDLWTLVKYVGASYVSGAARRWAADQAAENGIKLIMSYTAPYSSPDNPGDFASKETIKAHLDLYNIPQYRNHPGVYGHIVTGEPCMDYSFDPRSPSAKLLTLIDVMRYACDYVRSLDPTHPVWIALNAAGAYSYSDPDWIEKRKAWINLFIDFCDVLDYHIYLHGDAGTEYWRNPEQMRSRLVTMLDEVLIPCSRGKPIIIGETGCPTENYVDWRGQTATFTEEQQAEYFRIFGEETKKRGILVFVFKLIDPPGETHRYGLFRAENDGKMNIPKLAAGVVKEYLAIPPPKHVLKVDAAPISVTFTVNGVLKMTPYEESLEEGEYIIIVPQIVYANNTYVFVQWEDGSTSSREKLKLTTDVSLLANYMDPP